MKIAFLNIFQGNAQRGAETFVAEVSERLNKNHEVDIYSEKVEKLTRWPILWRFYIDPHGLKIALFTLKCLPKLFKKRHDVYVTLNSGWQPVIIRLVTLFIGGKLVIPGQSGKGWDDRINLWSFPDIFIGLSVVASRWGRKVNPFIRIAEISNGVDLERFNSKGDSFKTQLKKPIVLSVGAFSKEKRLELVIEAVSKLKGVSLLIAGGGGSNRKEIEEKGKKLLGQRFYLTSVPFNEMPKLYRSADIFTLPSWPLEAFGNVLVEAMATGLPVVATDDLIRREIVGDAGLFIDPENTSEYAKALEKALVTNWGDRPRKQAEKFSWDKIALEYEKLFEELVHKK